jgi:hypothetical protein
LGVISFCGSAFGSNFEPELLPVSRLRMPLPERLLEGAADGHHLADRLHLRAQHRFGARELLELPRGIFTTT